jgi:23S rRNA pseudouridine955/2504/2580 synthase/23S rRNA pseudouridine1911/1915/1917 synthase
MPEIREPAVLKDFRVLYDDSALLVIDKPGDLPCHPGGRYFQNTLWWLLRNRYDEEPLSLVNRLDRETSGILLVARNKWAARELGRQFRAQSTHKRYLVLVEGLFPDSPIEARGFLVRDRESAVRKRRRFVPSTSPAPPDEKALPCMTTLGRLHASQGVSLVEALPHTGRPHQIRATLSSLGYPVVGDKIYGPDEGCFVRFIQGGLTMEDKRLLRMPRQALHAAGLRFYHPATGMPLRIMSKIPEDMALLMGELGVRLDS